MLDFFKSFFRPVPPSGTTAKERLRLVLLSDHLSLAPDVVESLKRDLLEVISRYVEIDPAHADVTFEQRESEVAMLANIPITGVRARERPVAAPVANPVPPPPPTHAVAAAQTHADSHDERDAHDEPALPLALVNQSAPSTNAAAPADHVKPPRRRRRRKKASPSAAAPASSKLATGSA